MAEIDDLLASLASLLGRRTKLGYDANSAIDDVYEGYLWSEVIRVAQAQTPPWTVSFKNAGPSGQDFLFRNAPGVIYSNTQFTYAELARGPKVLELHIGVRVLGASNVPHEFDVLLLCKNAAANARALGQNPRSGSVVMHLEGKFFSGNLSLDVARSIVGLHSDCAVKAHLVSRKGGTGSIRTLLKYHNCTYVHSVFPGDSGPAFLEKCIAAALARA